MASKTYTHNYRLSKSGNTFTVLTTDYGPATVTDNGTDPGGDNPNTLGDVPNDTFHNSAATNASLNSTYIGSDTVSGDSAGSFVATYSNGQQTNYFLYTNTARTNGSAVTFNTAQSTPICYAEGTRILTVRGEVAVEDLRVGDLATTASGAGRPIRWIGHRKIDPRRYPQPEEAVPVRIAAHAFGLNRPARDLRVSPGHCICLDILGEVLVPASALVNGTTVVREEVESVTYWHVELDSHDLLIAENQAAESYLDMGNRVFFAHSTADQSMVDLSASPDADPAARTHADFCRPFHGDGPLLEVVRSQLRSRASALGWRLIVRDTWADVHLEVDGRIVRPKTRDLSASFLLPADAREVWLVCPTSVPRFVDDNPDGRALGLCLEGVRLDDGLGEAKTIALDDPLLSVGFHGISPGHRWTEGRAHLPTALFDGLEGPVFLRLDLSAPSLPRWVAAEALPDFGSAVAPDAIAA